MRSSAATVILRTLFGLAFLVFGMNKFLHFIPNPQEPQAAMDFFGALFRTGYFLPLLAATEIVSGALLLSGIFAPFALVLIAPVIVNIFMFHVFLAWQYRWAYAPMFSRNRSEAIGTPFAADASV